MGTPIGRGLTAPAVKADKKTRFQRPSQYQVYLLNDDYTPMDFVVDVLQQYFAMNYAYAVKTMLDVHHHGKGICGVYTRDIAETKVAQVNEFAKLNGHPLLCRMEKV